MPTTVTKTVKPSGGDYTSLSAAIAGEKVARPNLVTNDEILVIECYAMLDSTAVTVDGFTTDATRYVRITVPASERHNGTRSPTKYRLVATADFGSTLNVLIDYCYVEGLQIRNSGTAASNAARVFPPGGPTSRIEFIDCIAYDTSTTGAGGGVANGFRVEAGDVRFINCVAMAVGGGGFGGSGFIAGDGGASAANVKCLNCVAVNIPGGSGFRVTGFRTLTAKNCYAGGNGTDYVQDTNGTLTLTTCYSADGSRSTPTVAFSTVNFIDVARGYENLHLPIGSGLRAVGTDLSGDPLWTHPSGFVDFDGHTRYGTWSVGADHGFAVVTKTVKSSGGDYTSLAAAIAGEAAIRPNLTTRDELLRIECYAMLDTAAVTVSGFTTDAARYLHIVAPIGERHTGKRDATKYRLIGASGFGASMFAVAQSYTRIEGLQVRNTAGEGRCVIISGGVGVVVADTIAYDSASWGFRTESSANAVLINCIAFGCGNGIGNSTSGTSLLYAFNCTAVACTGVGFLGDNRFGRVTALKNCYAGGNTGADFDATNGFTTVAGCYSEDGTGGTPVAAYSTSTGAKFVNVTAGSEDLTIASDSVLRDAGVEASADGRWAHPNGAVDVVGVGRRKFDVGPFEVADVEAGTLLAHRGTFVISASDPAGSIRRIRGLGFQGKALLVWAGRAGVDGAWAAHATLSYGIATSPAQRWVISSFDQDALGTSDTVTALGEDAVAVGLSDGAGTVDYRVDFAAWNTDGFDLSILDAPSTDIIVHYLVLGGSDITAAKAGSFVTVNAATQDVTIDTGWGQPDFMSFAGYLGSGGGIGANMAFGFARSDQERMAAAYRSTDNAGTMNTGSVLQAKAHNPVHTSAGIDVEFDLATKGAWPADGFRVAYSIQSGTRRVFYLALKGGFQAKIGMADTIAPTDDFNRTENPLGSQSHSFSADSFTDPAGTLLTAHTSDAGETWTKHSSSGASAQAEITALGRVYVPQTFQDSFWYSSAVPASADYDVEADIVYLSSVAAETGVLGRVDPAAKTFYMARYTTDSGMNRWELYRYVAGTGTLLGNFPDPLELGRSYRLKLEMRGAVIRVLVNGVPRIVTTDASPISAAGRAGITFNTKGTAGDGSNLIQLDNLRTPRGWATANGCAAMQANGSTARNTDTGGVNINFSYRTDIPAFTDGTLIMDYAQVATNREHTLFARCSDPSLPGWTGYKCLFYDDGTAGLATVTIRKGAAANATVVATTTVAFDYAAGDRFAFSLSGNRLKALLYRGATGAFSTILDVTDSTYSSGYVGFGGQGNANIAYDNFMVLSHADLVHQQDLSADFAPQAAFVFSDDLPSHVGLDSGHADGHGLSFGAFDSVTQGLIDFQQDDGNTNSVAKNISDSSRIVRLTGGTGAATPADRGSATAAFSGNNLRLNWTSPDASPRRFAYVLLGPSAGGGGPTLTPVAIAAGVTMGGAITRLVTGSRLLALAPSLSPTIARQLLARRAQDLSFTLAGTFTRKASYYRDHAQGVTLTPSLTANRFQARLLAAAMTLTGAVTALFGRYRSMNTGVTLTPTMTRRALLSRLMAVNLSLPVTMMTQGKWYRVFAAPLTFAVEIRKWFARQFNRVVTVTVDMIQAIPAAFTEITMPTTITFVPAFLTKLRRFTYRPVRAGLSAAKLLGARISSKVKGAM
jgi:hypothetical protein